MGSIPMKFPNKVQSTMPFFSGMLGATLGNVCLSISLSTYPQILLMFSWDRRCSPPLFLR